MTKIINLYGGPGAGKSTMASQMYYQLKANHVNAELVREYIKDWAFESRTISAYDQIYILGKQVRRESLLYGKVDVIVTDSPILVSTYYAHKFCSANLARAIESTNLAFYDQAANDGHKQFHYFISRSDVYDSNGRYQNFDQAKVIDTEMKEYLTSLNIPFTDIPYNVNTNKILSDVIFK